MKYSFIVMTYSWPIFLRLQAFKGWLYLMNGCLIPCTNHNCDRMGPPQTLSIVMARGVSDAPRCSGQRGWGWAWASLRILHLLNAALWGPLQGSDRSNHHSPPTTPFSLRTASSSPTPLTHYYNICLFHNTFTSLCVSSIENSGQDYQ